MLIFSLIDNLFQQIWCLCLVFIVFVHSSYVKPLGTMHRNTYAHTYIYNSHVENVFLINNYTTVDFYVHPLSAVKS